MIYSVWIHKYHEPISHYHRRRNAPSIGLTGMYFSQATKALKVLLFRIFSNSHFVFLEFLGQLMSLYVASHYKNQPNDLQLLSDAPAHHLFVLCPPISQNQTSLPMPLVVLQIALEGRISKESISSGEVYFFVELIVILIIVYNL